MELTIGKLLDYQNLRMAIWNKASEIINEYDGEAIGKPRKVVEDVEILIPENQLEVFITASHRLANGDKDEEFFSFPARCMYMKAEELRNFLKEMREFTYGKR